MPAFDIHVHTRQFSDCSFINPEEVIPRALAARLDGLALTEHGTRWPDEPFEALRRQAEANGLVLINGQEIYTTDARNKMEGEFLVFGIDHSLTGSYSARQLVEVVHSEGGILIAAHPYKLSRNGRTHYYGAGDGLYHLAVDGLELHHPDHGESALRKARKAMEVLGIPGTGGSDAHKPFAIGTFVTLFDAAVRNETDFIREIRLGNVRGERRI